MINRNPTTVGGNTKGKRKNVSTIAFHLNFRFAITFPRNSPNKDANVPETTATSIDNLIGDQKSADIGFTLVL
jgi:hypothetical protein